MCFAAWDNACSQRWFALRKSNFLGQPGENQQKNGRKNWTKRGKFLKMSFLAALWVFEGGGFWKSIFEKINFWKFCIISTVVLELNSAFLWPLTAPRPIDEIMASGQNQLRFSLSFFCNDGICCDQFHFCLQSPMWTVRRSYVLLSRRGSVYGGMVFSLENGGGGN